MTLISDVTKTILISVDLSELRVAVVEEGRTVEALIERRGQGSLVGNIYKAKIDNVLRGMEAAFVDLGLPRNGFLHVNDVVVPGETSTRTRRRRKIDELLKPGQEVLVQVVKDSMGTKGPRVTMELSIAGRFLVLSPNGEAGSGVSRRLPDGERERLRKLAKALEVEEGGVIVRTAAAGATAEDLDRDLRFVRRIWSQVKLVGRDEEGAEPRPRRGGPLAQGDPRPAGAKRAGGAGRLRAPVPPDPRLGAGRRSRSSSTGSSSTPTRCRCSSATGWTRRS